MPTRSRHARGAGESELRLPGSSERADAPRGWFSSFAQDLASTDAGAFRIDGVAEGNVTVAIPTAAARPWAPAVRGPSPRPPASGWAMRAGRKGTASRSVGARPLHRDADAQPARVWRSCAARYFRLPALGGMTRIA